MLRALARRLRAALRRAPAAPAARPDYAAIGRALAAEDARRLAARRATDAAARGALLRLAPERTQERADEARRNAAAGRPSADGPAATSGDRPVGFRIPGVADRERLTPPVGVDIVRDATGRGRRYALAFVWALGAALGAALAGARPAAAQAAGPDGGVRIRDLTQAEGAAPIRLMGYGLAVGLDGSGDRAAGTGGMTVQSVVNLLRNFNVEVPSALVRTRNAAAVLVTAEVSPYLRAGGRFEVQVASLGDARSLRGGMLYMTPLLAEAGGRPVAAAQGALMISDGVDPRNRYGPPAVETTVRLPGGGQLEADLPRPTLAQSNRLLLREPDIGTATKIAAAVNAALGPTAAAVEDPGAVTLNLPAAGRAAALARLGDLRVSPDRAARVVIDARDGTVVAGGDLVVGAAVVSHGAVTLSIAAGGAAAPGAPSGDVRVAPGTSVQQVAAALHAVQTPAGDIAAIFAALREVGALAAEVTVR
ncbi:hypothetical protein tb265_17420 [Gemmatimonadetes bacterium T265]|nr:hypothetical protein tb265_17420 [Gemmatimonadetes bacterium T265]